MPLITYSASRFGKHWGAALSGTHALPVSWNDLVWAAITVGKPGFAYLFAHAWHSVSDLIVRAHTLYANLKEGEASSFERSGLYNDLDPSEKSGVSYFMGMVAAKALALRILDVPWLFHLSLIESLGGAVVLLGDSRPDLIGLRRNRDWVVAEAKGRTWGFSAPAMQTAKLQSRQVRRINGAYPALRVGVQAYFTPQMEWALEDPAEHDASASDMQFDLRSAISLYYSPLMAATEQTSDVRLISGRQFTCRKVEEIGVTVAIDNKLRHRIGANDLDLEDWDNNLGVQTSNPQAPDHGFALFPDGLGVALDHRWSENRMRSEPSERRTQ